MSSTQLSFTLSTGSKVDAVHLVGSWDKYKQHLPLSSSRAGRWKGTFKFPSSTMRPGSRYWYYYIIDNIKVTHDPNERSIVEPSTKRTLNVLDVPRSGGSSSAAPIITQSHSHAKRSSTSSKRDSHYSTHSNGVAKGRPISPSRIVAPRPSRPYESRAVREADYSHSPSAYGDDICAKLESTSLYPSKYGSTRNISPPSSISSSSSSSRGDSSSSRTSPSSFSSLSSPSSSLSSSSSHCRCNKYGITRRGDRVKLDCGGRVCCYGSSSEDDDSDDGSESCSSIDSRSESESEEIREAARKGRSVTYREIRPRERVGAGRSSGGRSGRR